MTGVIMKVYTSKEKALPAYELSAGPLHGAATAEHAHEPSMYLQNCLPEEALSRRRKLQHYHRIASRRRLSRRKKLQHGVRIDKSQN